MAGDKAAVGFTGESYVARLLDAKLSDDKWDQDKDMTSKDGLKIEVKTQVRCQFNNTFTINSSKENNLRKCMEADRLIFVEIMPAKTDSTVKVWECMDRHDFVKFRTDDCRRMLGWNVSSMKLLVEENNPELADALRKDSASTYTEH